MSETQWIEWTRTKLLPQEREELSAALTSEQKAHLRKHDYVWARGVGVFWNPPHGEPLRRARFTHGTHFQTERGELYIDSEGSAREIAHPESNRPRPAEATAGESSHEGETAARPTPHQAHRGRGEDPRGTHHP